MSAGPFQKLPKPRHSLSVRSCRCRGQDGWAIVGRANVNDSRSIDIFATTYKGALEIRNAYRDLSREEAQAVTSAVLGAGR